MYTVEWAATFNGFTKENPMDLHKFSQFFKEHIADRYFTFGTTSKRVPYFVIETQQNQLPHLIGLQRWANLEVRQPEKQLERLVNGEWDIPYLAAADEGAYKEYRERIEFLPYLYKLLYMFECRVKLINQNIGGGFNRRKANLIFQKDGVKYIYVLELRQKGKELGSPFIPTSVTVHRKNSNALRIKSEPLTITEVLVEKNN